MFPTALNAIYGDIFNSVHHRLANLAFEDGQGYHETAVMRFLRKYSRDQWSELIHHYDTLKRFSLALFLSEEDIITLSSIEIFDETKSRLAHRLAFHSQYIHRFCESFIDSLAKRAATGEFLVNNPTH